MFVPAEDSREQNSRNHTEAELGSWAEVHCRRRYQNHRKSERGRDRMHSKKIFDHLEHCPSMASFQRRRELEAQKSCAVAR